MVIELDTHYENRRADIEKIVRQVLELNQLDLSDVIISNLSIHLTLCVSRELNGSYIPTSESQMAHLKKHEYYTIAREIINALEKEYQIQLDDNQVGYTTMYLANMNLLDMDFDYDVDLFDDEMASVINETVDRIENELNIHFMNKESFYSGLTLHFYPALERLQTDTQLNTNPLKDEIISHHETEYQCARIFNSIVDKHYHKTFNDYELAYIALHFGSAVANK